MREYNHFYHQNHREQINARHALAVMINPEKAKTIQYKSYWRHREERLKHNREYRLQHKDGLREKAHKRRLAVRLAAINRLGNKCVKCGFSDLRALQIDHINGGGHIDRKNLDGEKFHNVILSLPDDILHKDFQLLCANCNWIKKVVNREDRHFN